MLILRPLIRQNSDLTVVITGRILFPEGQHGGTCKQWITIVPKHAVSLLFLRQPTQIALLALSTEIEAVNCTAAPTRRFTLRHVWPK